MKAYLHRRILWLWILTILWTIFLICSYFIKVGNTFYDFWGEPSDYVEKASLWDFMVSRFPKLGETKKWQLFLVVLFAYIVLGCIDFFVISPFFWKFTREGKNWNMQTKIDKEKLTKEYNDLKQNKKALMTEQNKIFKKRKRKIIENETK